MSTAPFRPCIPTRCTKVSSHSDWIHEVKQDGFRLIVQRDGERVRLFTRNGYDWTSRYPLIVEAAGSIRTKQFVIDGEAVLLGVDGISDFDGLYSGPHNDEVQLYAFDILALDGDDLRKLPLHLRKTNLARLLALRRIHRCAAACGGSLEAQLSNRASALYKPSKTRCSEGRSPLRGKDE
jgi:ATP-dependent DNA ligase